MVNAQGQQLRQVVHGFLAGLPVPDALRNDLSAGSVNGDAVGFTHEWRVRGDAEYGIEASVRDHDDVIEFGLLLRDGRTSIPVLHATLVLENEESELNCMSESNDTMNFDAYVTSQDHDALDRVLKQFAIQLTGSDD